MLKKLSPFHSASASDLVNVQQQQRQATRRFSADFARTPDGFVTPGLSPSVAGHSSSNGYFPPSPALSAGNGFDFNREGNAEGVLNRQGLQKSLRGLEGVLTALDEFRELADLLHKSRKKLSRAIKELAGGIKETLPKNVHDRDVIFNTLLSSSSMIESFAETDFKFGKIVQKQYDSANDACAKAFKKIAREEKDHDEVMANLDFKFKRASANYDKRMRATHSPQNAVGEHEKHIALVTAISSEMNSHKQQHGCKMRDRRDTLVLDVARFLSTLADGEFRRACEGVRKSGACVGPLASWSALILSEASIAITLMPEDLEDPRSRQSPTSQVNSAPLPVPDSPEQAMYSTSRPTMSSSGTFIDLSNFAQVGQQSQAKQTLGQFSTRTSPTISQQPFQPPPPNRFDGTPYSSRPASPALTEPTKQPYKSHSYAPSQTNTESTLQNSRSPSFADSALPETAGTRYASLPQDSIPVASTSGPSNSQHPPSKIGSVIEEEEEAAEERSTNGIQRTLSMESTDSSRSFVARMKERYLEDKLRYKEPILAPSSGNVASISQKWESASPPVKRHQPRPSLPNIPDPIDSRQNDLRSTFGQVRPPSVTEVRAKLERQTSDLPHSDHCGCASCSKSKYAPRPPAGRADRRISMPIL